MILRKEENATALHLSIESDVDIKIIRMLIQHGPYINALDINLYTPFHHLFLGSVPPETDFYFDKFQLLLNSGASVNAKLLEGSQVMHGAVHVYHSREREKEHDASVQPLCVKVIERLIECRAELDVPNLSMLTPFQYAISTGCNHLLECFLNLGVDVNKGNQIYTAPFMLLAKTNLYLERYEDDEKYVNRILKCIDLLLLHEANINIKNKLKDTPLHYLLHSPTSVNIKVLQTFLKKGASVNQQNSLLQSPIFCIGLNKQEEFYISLDTKEEIIRILKQYGAKLDLQDINGRTPLCWYFKQEDKEMVEILLQTGSDVNARDKFGRTCCHYAALEDMDQEWTTLLEAYGAVQNIKDLNGMTPLMYESYNGKYKKLSSSMMTYVNILKLCDRFIPANVDVSVEPRVNILKEFLGDTEDFCLRLLQDKQRGCLLMNKELNEIKNEVHILLQRIANIVKEKDSRFAFTPELSGSMCEGTKIGNMDEFDYICYS